MEKLFIVIPAYNESENIKTVVEEWYPVVEKHNRDGESRMVIIDDGSKDDTYKILQELEKDRPLMTAITKKNSGHGGTVLYGYKYALEQGADYVFQTDSDGQTRPSEFDLFWEARKQYAMVIGDRCKRQDGFSRIIVTKVLKLVVRLCFGVKITDVNTPYRLMQAEYLRDFIKYIPDDFFLSNVLLCVICAKKNAPMKFIPITFRPRQGGVNSINLKRIFKIGKQALKDFREINKKLKTEIDYLP